MRLRVNSISINYELTGKGDCLALIHGLSENLAIWKNQVSAFARHYQVLAYDVRGQGQSDVGDGDCSAKVFAHDLCLLLDALKIKDTFIVGFSMGGVIALQFALDYSQRTKGIVVLSSSSECNAQAARWYEERAALAERRGLEAVAGEDAERCFTPQFRDSHPEVVAKYKTLRSRTNPRGYARAAQAMAELYPHPLTPELSKIKCPTLILVGEQDMAAPPGGSVIMHRRIPGSQLRIVKGWAHQVLLEAPQELNTTILDFLTSLQK